MARNRPDKESRHRVEETSGMRKTNRKTSTGGDNRGEFDDLISALRTGDVFGDEFSKMKGRRRTAPPKQARRVDNVSERERASPLLATKF